MTVEFCYFEDLTANQKGPSSRMCIVHTGNNTVSSRLCSPSPSSLRLQKKVDFFLTKEGKFHVLNLKVIKNLTLKTGACCIRAQTFFLTRCLKHSLYL